MTKMTPRTVFLRAIEDRITSRPFETISAYKVRESRDNIAHVVATLTEIISVVSSGKAHSVPILLGGCTTDDKANWLKDLPSNLAGELGGNLVPAIHALTEEGVPQVAITSCVQSIKEDVNRLLENCGIMQAETSRTVKDEYARMKAGHSEMLRICKDALRIADRAVALCDTHGV